MWVWTCDWTWVSPWTWEVAVNVGVGCACGSVRTSCTAWAMTLTLMCEQCGLGKAHERAFSAGGAVVWPPVTYLGMIVGTVLGELIAWA